MIVPRTLFGKLLLLFLGFSAIMIGVFFVVMHISHETYHLESDQMVNRDLAQQYVAANLLVREPPLSENNLAQALGRIAEINPNIDAYVLDTRGEILSTSIASGLIVGTRVSLKPVVQFLDARAAEGHIVFPILGDDPTNGHRAVFSAAPLSIPGSASAYLYIVLNPQETGSAVDRLKTMYAIGEGAGFILVAVVLAIVGSLLLLRLLTRRLGTLQEDMERFRDSHSVVTAPPIGRADQPPGDEIERLRFLFLQLAQHIRGQMLELQQTDEMRRELLANISHDLRTPLTTLQMHLETLSIKEDLPPEERRASLAVTVGQCRRLIRLVGQLLELAKLDALQVSLSPEPFHLAELAQDIAMKFELTARRKGALLRVEYPAGMPLVSGDIALIERVFDNLIENALRYVRAGGGVTVRFMTDSRSVRVEVHDTGPGIPESERGRIFDRFYGCDTNRLAGSGHTGLGLAIVRSILALHGQTIDFMSGPGGTTFFFDLPTLPAAEVPRSPPEDLRYAQASAG